MKVLVVFLVGVVAAASAVSFFELVHEEWKSFKATHNKLYGDDTEEKFRMKIFMENKHSIAKHNQLYEQGKVSFKLALNKYADLLPHEFTNLNGYNKTLKRSSLSAARQEEGVTFLTPANVQFPDTVDWRKKGAVTPIKDQGHCGSCWSFSATGALEGQHFRKTGVLVSLSEQNLVDCSAVYGNNGCNGGLMDNAFKYIKDNGGIDTEKSYPYEGKDDTCRYDAKTSGATDKGFVDIEQGDEEKMKQALATIGPVSVAIDASHQSFQFYSEGVYYEPLCDSENLDHGVLVVGYGTDEKSGADYWIVKNSWGTSWGDKGYVKMARNKENHCGIASSSSYPLVWKTGFIKKSNNGKGEKAKVTQDIKSDKSTNQSQPQGGVRKKTKFVNLYSQDGQIRDSIVLLKGRHLCNCQASKHKLIDNCLKCGRIVCEQEGSGPCLFCVNLVCSEEELRVIEQSGKKGDGLKKSLMQQQRPKGWEEAMAMRNRLLEFDQSSEKRTTVIDDECDYFKSNSVWLSDSERKKLKELEEKMEAKRHASRMSRKVTLDFSGRQVIEEPQLAIDFQDEILREIAESCSINASINQKLARNNENQMDVLHPLLEYPAPVFDNTVVSQITSNTQNFKYDGVYNRVQDKELLEISDLRSCMSMHQHWASLLVAGIKKHEGRPWYTAHRGRLWIASTSKPVDMEDVRHMEQFYRSYYHDESIEFPSQYPSGCLLGCVLVQDCLPQEEYRKTYPTGESDSPFVFVCSEPQELPIRFPIKGMHKIYKLDQNIHIAAVKALQRAAKLLASEE